MKNWYLIFLFAIGALGQPTPPKTTANTRIWLGTEGDLRLANVADPSTTPPSGYVSLFATGDAFKYMTSDGVSHAFGGGGGGSPGGSSGQLQFNSSGSFGGTVGGTVTALTNFWFGNIYLTNNFTLAGLSGLVKANGTSVATAAAAGTDYVGPGAYTGSGLTLGTGKLLGRNSASSGAAEELVPSGGLTISAGQLNGPNWVASGSSNATLTGISSQYGIVVTNLATFANRVSRTGVITPTQITSDQNDYNPTGYETNYTWRLTSDAARNITGIVGALGPEEIELVNVGSFNIVLKAEDSGSVATNRFSLNADITMLPNHVLKLFYDQTSTRWRAVRVGPNIPVSAVYGGTGVQTYTTGDILYASATDTLAKLARGNAWQVLQMGTGNIQQWSDAPWVLNRVGTVTNINTTTSETVAYTNVIPANVLGTNRTARFVIRGDVQNNSGSSATFTLRVYYGSTKIYDDVSTTFSSSTTVRPYLMELRFSNLDVTNSQRMDGVIRFGANPTAVTTGWGDFSSASYFDLADPFGGTSAVDSTASAGFGFTIQPSVSNASTYWKVVHAVCIIE